MNKINKLFEVSWEVCNKVGGINTVIASKVVEIKKQLSDNYILIGPDLVRDSSSIDTSFIEDSSLFQKWRQSRKPNEVHFRAGRWDIESSPSVLLIDFTSLYSKKDEIFTKLWDEFSLDSLSGQWDYIEPAMFGYAAGEIINSFYNYYLKPQDVVLAHFHEWMAGAGVLYLKMNSPAISTIFTTHATILGRTLAGNNVPIYENLANIQPVVEARKYNIMARYSLERTAANNADTFTTVSTITAKECEYFLKKKPNIVTPNGFNINTNLSDIQFSELKESSRKKIISSVKNVLGYEIDNDAFLLLNSGRYEFKNKGIDIFIDALNKLKNENHSDKELVAVIAVPANSAEVHSLVAQRMNGDFSDTTAGFLTHRLFHEEYDLIINFLKSKGFTNEKNSKIKIIFAPIYLNGSDGLFNLNYYDFLAGFDLSVFPSYYEPWGYTPMESLALRVPTITTSLAGFGQWIHNFLEKGNIGAKYIFRDDFNYDDAVKNVAEAINFYLKSDDYTKINDDALLLSQLSSWEKLAEKYFDAYNLAIKVLEERLENLGQTLIPMDGNHFKAVKTSTPNWKKAFVVPRIPPKLVPLVELSKNLWWSWNFKAVDLFESIDPIKWNIAENNPIILLESLDYIELQALELNESFIENLNKVYAEFTKYLEVEISKETSRIAYFSMEYGIHDSVKIFSGGLGILAGDYLKEISDQNVNLVAVGLLYRYGYFSQKITLLGDQIAESKAQKFTHMPVEPVFEEDGRWLQIEIEVPGRTIKAKVWRLNVGRVKLYLLDTDIEENNSSDRAITHHLYGGGNENRLLQEILLGLGGVRVLNSLGEKPQIFHLNEGHAAMTSFERLRNLINNEGLTFQEAKEVVRASSLFTTHTPVPAGHDRFEESVIRRFLPHYADRLSISWEEFIGLGRVNANDSNEQFSMSVLAANMSQEMNGVSKIHGEVSREMFANMYPGYFPQELFIAHVTNGVHFSTWTSKKWQKLFANKIKIDFNNQQNDLVQWQQIENIEDKEIWTIRQQLRAELITTVKSKLHSQMTERMEDPNIMFRIINSLDSNVLTIGFARRFATYKRALLLFSNLEKLEKLVSSKKRPIQFIFAGKAHPADKAGQDLIKRILEISKMPQFEGKIVFVADYDIELAKKLVQGVDVWLNNPTRPLEASGTSGEKAAMNGVLNLSVLDGWWAEGYVQGAGWALDEKRTYDNENLQNELDATNIYQIIENEISVLFYNRDKDGLPHDWINVIKANFREIAPHFTMNRMVDDYVNLYYNKLIERSLKVNSENYKLAKEINTWKSHILTAWKSVEVVNISYTDSAKNSISIGDNFKVKVWLKIIDINPEDIKVEFIKANKDEDTIVNIINSQPLKLDSFESNIAKYSANVNLSKAGVFNFSFRVFPWNNVLPHRQDLCVVEWI